MEFPDVKATRWKAAQGSACLADVEVMLAWGHRLISIHYASCQAQGAYTARSGLP
jgi:hypothetical protein